MKTKILTILALICYLPIFAQDWERNGSIILPTEYLGTNNLQPLRIFTSGFERMRITETGNVGIGLLTPLSKVHVHDLAVPTWMQVTNDLSGFTILDGLRIGIAAFDTTITIKT